MHPERQAGILGAILVLVGGIAIVRRRRIRGGCGSADRQARTSRR
jgi:hypothetical protein